MAKKPAAKKSSPRTVAKKSAPKKTAATKQKAKSAKNTTAKKSTATKTTLKTTAKKKSASSKRELIDTGRDKRFVRRDSEGQFKESDDVGRSLSQDRRRKATTKSKSGQGDKGDRSAI